MYEDILKVVFREAFNSLIDNKEEVQQGYKAIIRILKDTLALDKKSAKLQNEHMLVAELIRKCVDDNAREALDQTEYQLRYSSFMERYENIKKEIGEIEDERLERNAKRENIETFIHTLEQNAGLISEFDEDLWIVTVDSIMIHSEHDAFTFKDSMVLDWNI